MQNEFESIEEELNKVYVEDELVKEAAEKTRLEMIRLRGSGNNI
ncbi:MAG: hypothetical protein ACRYFB_02705 [Janthinobacterium lividum]